jgi:hypothetical protein
MSSEHGQVSWRGKPVTARQRQALLAAEKRIRRRYWGFRFTVYQGSWQQSTSYSGTTHTGAGVVDLGYPGMSNTGAWAAGKMRYVLRCLREEARQAAFCRGPWCDMPFHYHVPDLDTHGMDGNAAWQVDQYRAGCDGLTAGHPDPFPYRPAIIHKWRFK